MHFTDEGFCCQLIREVSVANGNPENLSLIPCHRLRGVGKKLTERLAHLGIHHVQDILFHLPFRYQDRTRVYSISNLKSGDYAVVEGEIESIIKPLVGRTRLMCRLFDGTGRMTLRFFYAGSFHGHQMKVGERLRCYGEVRYGSLGFEMIHPEYYLMSDTISLPIPENLTPIYPTTEGLNQLTWRKLTTQGLQLLSEGKVLQDILPISILENSAFPTLKEALCFLHRPPLDAPLDLLQEGQHISQKRLGFEELLAHHLSLLRLKKKFQVQETFSLKNISLTEKFLQQLPFQLTSAQQKVIAEIKHDLVKTHPMLRLVQGDVGSGKTVVAATAILQAIDNGYQAALLAPTELLAEQHFATFTRWFKPLNVKVVLLSGQMKTSIRREILTTILAGNAHLIIGTHAIFQKNVTFSQLALIVVDEQHRFGVRERSLLREKGIYQNKYPHQLIMTATPIPRTLAMSAYADLDCSVIDALPPGRTPVTTLVISNAKREDVLERIREACLSGRQVYWVCTLIEESEVLQCEAASNTKETLSARLPEIKIALIHGRMKSQDKEAIMQAFSSGEVQLLVATTVIEVGVDVPNASLMVIENAERLGLAQLHQLRGRVGRGSIVSHCVLLYQSPLSKLAKERLAIMRETTDGFKIAEKDLQMRGPGEVLGTKQTGEMNLRVADLIRDSDLLIKVQEAATIVLNHYPERVDPLIQRWLRNNTQYGQV